MMPTGTLHDIGAKSGDVVYDTWTGDDFEVIDIGTLKRVRDGRIVKYHSDYDQGSWSVKHPATMPPAPGKPLSAHTTMPIRVHEGYDALLIALTRALHQAQEGKGVQRHGNGLPFKDQPIMAITRRRGFGFPFGQIEKKIDEAEGMIARNELNAAEAELLGAINYLAAAVLRINEIATAQMKEE